MHQVLEEAGFTVADLELADPASLQAELEVQAAVVDFGAAGSVSEFAALLSAWSNRLPVLGVVPGAAVEAELLAALAQRPANGAVDLCRTEDLAVQVRARMGLLASRCSSDPSRDPLTGLGSREAMRHRLDRLLADLPASGAVAAFILDLDHFKSINDQFGHAAGDWVLRGVARVVMNFSTLRNNAYRIGGEEFGGFLFGRSRSEITDTVEHLRRAIAETQVPLEQAAGEESGAPPAVRVTASIGFTFLEPGMPLESVYLQADEAMYAAKNAGRNRAHCYDLCWDAAEADPNLAALAHFENVTRVWTGRMAELITSVGRRALEETRRSAERDGLTDLFNRRHFDRRISREIDAARKSGSALSLILLDVDNFHSVNLEYGYPTGDRALKAVADLARNHSRLTDWVARYGGEEFCVVMPGAASGEAALVGERLRAALEAATIVGYGGRTLQLTASFGISSLGELPSDRIKADDLVQLASDRVVRAKQRGKNRVVGPAR